MVLAQQTALGSYTEGEKYNRKMFPTDECRECAPRIFDTALLVNHCEQSPDG